MKIENKNISFGISKISTEQFAIIPEAHLNGAKIQIMHEMLFGIDKINKIIIMKKLARFQHLESSPFMQIEVACHFNINPNDWDKIKKNDSDGILIPKDFSLHLGMIVIGVLRGVLHAKTENSIYNQYPFPTIDVTKLIPESLSLD